MLHFNKELINTWVDTPVVLYKLNVAESKKNIYDESTSKLWYKGVQLPCLITRQLSTAVKDIQTVNVEQVAEFAFLRQECKDRNVYPEIGDIIDFNSIYFEIENFNEVQLYAGQTLYNHTILCTTHMSRASNLQLEPPII
jgi:hypothetical protein